MVTKEQWAEIERKLSHAYGEAHLMVDGYKLTLQIAKAKALKYDIVWYVNGEFKGVWLFEDTEERRRFARPCSFAVFKPAKIKEIEKIFGKRRAAKEFPRLYEKRTFYQWSWPSFKPLMRHLIANNKSIEVLP